MALVVSSAAEVVLEAPEQPASPIAPTPAETTVIDLEAEEGPSTERPTDIEGPSGQSAASIPRARLDLLLTEVRGLFAINDTLLRKEQEEKATREEEITALKEQLAKAQGAIEEKDDLLQLRTSEVASAHDNLLALRAEISLSRDEFNTEKAALQASLDGAVAAREGAEAETAMVRVNLATALESVSAKDVRIASLRRQVSLVAERANKTVKKIRISNYICGYVDCSDGAPMKHSYDDLQKATEEAEAAEDEAEEDDSSDEEVDEEIAALGFDISKKGDGDGDDVGAGVSVVVAETADMTIAAGAAIPTEKGPVEESPSADEAAQKDVHCNPTSGDNTEKV